MASDSGTNTKRLLSLGSQIPRLNSVTTEQFSIANVRILHKLFISNKFPSINNVRDYLSRGYCRNLYWVAVVLKKKLWYRYFCKLPTQRYHVSVNTTSAGLVQLFLYLALFYSIFGRVVSKADLFLHSKTNENIIFQKSVYLMVYFILVFQNSMYLKLVYQLPN